MFSKQEKCKSKYKFGWTKVWSKAEEVRKYFVNPKIESFRLRCKLHYLQFWFQIYRSSRSQMFFGTGAFKNFAMMEFLFNKVAGLQAWGFIKKRLQHRSFSVKFAKEHLFYRTLPVAASGDILRTLSLLHMRMMNRVIAWYVLALQRQFHFIPCVSFLSISFFFSYFFVYFATCLGIEVSLSILKIKQWSCS